MTGIVASGRAAAARSWQRAPALLLAAAALAAGTSASAAPAAGAADQETTGTRVGASWRAGALGDRAAGVACWLRGADGLLRLEIARFPSAEQAVLDSAGWRLLLDRRGEGWTYVASGPGAATLGGWGAPLERADESLRLRILMLLGLREEAPGVWPADAPAAARLLAARPAAAAGRPGRPSSARDDPPGAGRLRLAWTDPSPAPRRMRESAFRAAQEQRGRGRGGDGEVWTVTWREDPQAGSLLRVVSSRRAGFLEIGPPRAREVRYRPEDAFVSLWSLGDLLAFASGGSPTGPEDR